MLSIKKVRFFIKDFMMQADVMTIAYKGDS